MPVALQGVLAALTAISASLVTWLVARRRTSGRVDTTEASTLWQEGAAMRAELRDETVSLRAEMVRMRDEAVVLRSEASTLRGEASSLRDEMAALRAESALLREETIRLNVEVAQLRDHITSMGGAP